MVAEVLGIISRSNKRIRGSASGTLGPAGTQGISKELKEDFNHAAELPMVPRPLLGL